MIYAEWNMLTEDEDLEIQEFYYANGWQVSKPMKYGERLVKYWIPEYGREKVGVKQIFTEFPVEPKRGKQI